MKPLNQNLVALVKLLNEVEFHDGTSIGKTLNISRAAVWKLIKKLEQYGIEVLSSKGKGYQLKAPLLLLDIDKLNARLRHKSVQLTVLEKTTSTNDYLKTVDNSKQAIITCLAELQTAGKGRLQRQWHSPFAENIYLSLLCPFEKDISELGGLSLVAALAVCHALERVIDFSGAQLAVKWPNDILLHGQKLVGILTEIEAESNGTCQVIIGIGINVNMKKALKRNINQAWTSIRIATQQYTDRNIIAAELIDTLIDYLERFQEYGLSVFKQEWQQRDCLHNTEVTIASGRTTVSGIGAGINQQGHLILKTAKQETLTFSSGDTTLLQ